MSVTVVVTEDAARDLGDIHGYVEERDGRIRADRLLDGLQGVLAKLSDFPLRGEYPPELLTLGIKQFRQVHYKPYRAIYQVLDTRVVVMLIADGRRDMRQLLERRLLG